MVKRGKSSVFLSNRAQKNELFSFFVYNLTIYNRFAIYLQFDDLQFTIYLRWDSFTNSHIQRAEKSFN